MDRLFLAGLVRELDAAVRGARVRTLRLGSDSDARAGADTRSLTLALGKTGAPAELVLHLAPGVAGIFTRERAARPARARAREAKLEKITSASSIVSVACAELDRVVTVTLEQTRLSGKTRRVAFVLELVPARASVFIVDADSSRIVDSVSTGSARLATGESYRALDPPPGAAPQAASAHELEARLESEASAIGTEPDRTALLRATGWTPLLVSEMQFLIEARGRTRAEAFTELNRRFEEPRPVLYVGASKVVMSPIPLESVDRLEPRPRASFNDVMADAVALTVDRERATALGQRLASAISRRFKSLRSLQRKLERQRDQLPPPAELRRRGETLLAGLARAERVDDTRVRLPDPFHPEGALVNIEIDPRLGLPENAERLFRRSRKAERTELELAKRLEALEQQLTFVESTRVSLDDAIGLDELDSIRQELEAQGLVAVPAKSKTRARPRGSTKPLPPRRFVTARGNVILVGRSGRSNAELTFHLAKPDDLWLHASGIPGSHVVLKCTAVGGPDEDEILAAAGYAAHFSKGRNETYVDVMVTPRRHVSAIKGAPPGLVRVAKSETVRVRPTPPRASTEAAEVG